MNLTELKRCDRGLVKRIDKHNHLCRMHGFRVGVVVDVVYHFKNKIAVIINHREMVAIPKNIAEHITVEKIK